MNAKGDKTEERPHRLARLLDVPDAPEVCSRDVLERIAALAPEPERKLQAAGQSHTGPTFDLHGWLASSGLKVSIEKAWGQATLYELESCPWNPEHHRTARIVQFESGALSAGCFHNGCQGKAWSDLREMVEGPARSKQRRGHNPEGAEPEERPGFRLTRVGDLLLEPPESPPWVWDETLPRGGVSILAAKPKVGKSTLARALSLAVARGEAFLGRPTNAGPAAYLALEEKRAEVASHLRRMGATTEALLVHTGAAPEESLTALETAVLETGAVLAVVDTLFKLVHITMERDILKKAAAYFAKESLPGTRR